MKRLFPLLILFLIISLLFAGCSFSFKPANELIRPPVLNGENSYLQQAFEESAGVDLDLTAPVNGDYRSSYLIYDLNRDGSDEALVFYSFPGTEKNINIAFFTYNSGKWVLTDTLKENVSEIYELSFSDINGDKTDELLISYSDGMENNQSDTLGNKGIIKLCVFSYNGTSLTLQKTDYYDRLFVSDLNSDGNSDLLLFFSDFNGENKEPRMNGKYLSFGSDYSIKADSEFSLQNIIEILNIATDKYTGDNEKYTRIYIDGLIGEGSLMTNILSVGSDSDKITDINSSATGDRDIQTLRSARIFSSDVNNDGIIEIPTTQALPGGMRINSDSEDTQLNLVVWTQLTDKGTETIFRSIYNSAQKYMFVFPDEWLNLYSAKYNYKSQTLFIYRLEDEKDLFSVRAFEKDAWKENNYGYSKIKSNDIYTYGYSILNDDASDMLKDIYSNFMITE
ncbi:MAG: hypothetical protein K5761_06715, partial [Clostridiales bacterium]|nr:hypothetical protein [Clostridiales bacterium]